MDVNKIHKLSFCNEESIRKSKKCGCYYCINIFDASEVKEFLHEKRYNKSTALCPRCGIDSVLGDADVEITSELLEKMYQEFFNINSR